MKSLLPFLRKHLDDLLILPGCACIVIGIAHWSAPAAWIAAGIELICLGILAGIGARNAHQ